MEHRQEIIDKIKVLLRSHRKGLTITEIAQKLDLNRNSAAKYLEILLMSGDVNLNTYGTAKVYTISHRMPVSALVTFSADIIIMIGRDMRVLDANKNALQILGLTREDIAGTRIDAIDSPLLEHLAIPEIFEEIQITGEILKEFSITSGNEEYHYRVRLIPTVFDNKESGIMVFGEDITKQIRFEQSLKISESRYRGIVQDQTDFICRGRPDGTVTFINEPLARFIGNPSSEINGKSFFPYIFPEDLPLAIEKMTGLSPDHPANIIEIRVMNYEGAFRWNMWSSRGIFDDEGNLVEWQSVGRDISERKEMEDALVRIQKAVDSSSEAIGITDPGGHHIYQNPALTKMLGYTQEELAHVPLPIIVYDDGEKGREIFETIMQGKSCSGETVMISKDGRKFEVSYHADSIRDDKGSIIGLITIHTDITERKRIENAMRESREFLNKIINSISDPIHVKDRNHRIVLINDAACGLFNLTREEIIGKTAYDLFPDKGMADISWQKDEEVFTTGKGIVNEETNIYAPGKTLTVLVKKTQYIDNAGNQFLVGITTDITERKQVEQALSDSELLYRTILDNIQDVYYRSDTNGILVMASPSAPKLLGYGSLDEIIGENISERFYFYPEEREKFLWTLYEKQKISDYEITLKKLDGSPLEVSTSSQLLFGPDGQITGIEGFFRDITFRKNAETALRESEERYRNVVEDQNEFICRFTPDGTHVFVNEAYCRYFGLAREKIMGSRFRPVIHPDDRESVARSFASLTPGNPLVDIEQRTINPDGSIRWQQWTDRAIFDEDGSLKEYQSVGRDITKTKEDAEALRESEERFRTLLDQVPSVAVQGYLPDCTVVYWNEANTRMYGYTPEEAMGRDIRELLIPAPARDEVTKVIARMTETGIPEPSEELALLHKDGSLVPVFSSHAVVKIAGRTTVQFCFDIDLTERKNAEKVIHESEERYRNVVEDQTELICRFTPDGIITFCNDAYSRYFGLKKEDCNGRAHRVVLPPEDTRAMKAHLASLSPEHPVRTIEHRVIMPNGNLVWHSWRNRAIFGPDGTVIEYQSVGRDITDIKEHTEKIRESEERFRMMANLSPFPISIMDGESKFRYLNPMFEQLFGYTLSDIPSEMDWLLKAFPNENERKEVMFTRKNNPSGSKPQTIMSRVFPVTCKDGTVHKARFFSATLQNGEKFVVYEDLEPKNELDQLRSFLASIVDSSNDAIIGKTLDGTIVSWNNAAERIYGYRAEEMIGKSIAVIISPKLRHQLPSFLERVRNGERIENFRTIRIRKDGNPITVSITLSPIKDENGRIYGVSTIAKNISDADERDVHRTM